MDDGDGSAKPASFLVQLLTIVRDESPLVSMNAGELSIHDPAALERKMSLSCCGSGSGLRFLRARYLRLSGSSTRNMSATDTATQTALRADAPLQRLCSAIPTP
jgi:hypothetical protein